MTDPDRPWEPPLAGTEAEHVLGALDRMRATFRWKTDGLDAAGLRVRVGKSSLTLGGLLKHLAFVEEYTFGMKLSGAQPGEYWLPAATDDAWVFTSAADDPPAHLYKLWDDAAAQARTRVAKALADGGMDQLVHAATPDGQHANLRRLLCDMVEEYGRHTGHADLLREAADGRVGEDPPAGWKPS